MPQQSSAISISCLTGVFILKLLIILAYKVPRQKQTFIVFYLYLNMWLLFCFFADFTLNICTPTKYFQDLKAILFSNPECYSFLCKAFVPSYSICCNKCHWWCLLRHMVSASPPPWPTHFVFFDNQNSVLPMRNKCYCELPVQCAGKFQSLLKLKAQKIWGNLIVIHSHNENC